MILTYMSLVVAEERKRWRRKGRNYLSAASFTAAASVEHRRVSDAQHRTADSAIAFLLTFSAAIVMTSGKPHQLTQ